MFFSAINSNTFALFTFFNYLLTISTYILFSGCDKSISTPWKVGHSDPLHLLSTTSLKPTSLPNNFILLKS